MLVSTGSASSTPTPEPADEAALLEALAEAGEALTAALLAHDLDGITTATQRAEALVASLERLTAGALPRRRPNPPTEIAARIAATARRNAVLLESAWATDAAILRLLAAAAAEADAGPGAYLATPAPATAPAGWLDRSA